MMGAGRHGRTPAMGAGRHGVTGSVQLEGPPRTRPKAVTVPEQGAQRPQDPDVVSFMSDYRRQHGTEAVVAKVAARE